MSDEGTRAMTSGLPRCDAPPDPAVIGADVDGWARGPAMRKLVSAFGGDIPDGPTGEILDYLEEFSAGHWDFRHGAERADAAPRDFDPAVSTLVLDGATALGLRDAELPRFAHYTHVLVLGGLAAACRRRTEFAARLLAGQVSADAVSAVGGFRELTGAERALTPGNWEVDAMEIAVSDALETTGPQARRQGGDPHDDPRRAWRITTCRARKTPVHVVAAPSRDPEHRRANTADTCRFWADEVAGLNERDRVLVVTSSIYAPFQHCDAVADIGLRYGCGVDTVGMPPDEEWRADQYLQEIRSAIRSMSRLWTRATTPQR